MPQRPYVSFVEVKEKVPIPDALLVLGLREQFTERKGTLTGVCPLPRHQHGPHPNPEQFKISRKEGLWLWHCFGDCQMGGDVVNLVKELTGFDNSHVRFWFAEHFGDRLTQQQRKRDAKPPSPATKKEAAPANPGQETSRKTTSTANDTIVPEAPPPLKPLRFHLDLDPAVPYLAQRGVQNETATRFGLGLCRKGVLKGYLAIPVFGMPHGSGTNPIGYLGRWPSADPATDDENQPRYKFPPEFPRNRVVYGLGMALDSLPESPLIVVEGPFKVFHLFQAGFPNTVATFGAHLSDEQSELLVDTGRPLILLYDGDEAGQKGMRLAAGKLITRAFVRVVKLPTNQEPDELSACELRRLLA